MDGEWEKKILSLSHTSREGAIYSVKTNPASKTHENLGRMDVLQNKTEPG